MEIAAENDITLPEDFKARHFSPDEDIVQFDLVMVMDKFTAADVLREVISRRSQLALKSVLQFQVHGLCLLSLSSIHKVPPIPWMPVGSMLGAHDVRKWTCIEAIG